MLRGLGRHADAERALLGALAARDRLDYVEANLALAAYAMDPQRARWQQARALLEAVLANDPQNEIALRLHERLGERGR